MPDDLRSLAASLGIDVEVTSWQGERSTVSDATLRAVLSAFGVDVDDPDAVTRALRREPGGLPAYVVAREGDETCIPTVAQYLSLGLEDGTHLSLDASDGAVTLPADLPVGYHRLIADDGVCTVIRPPRRMPLPAGLAQRPGWGLAAQLYSVRSSSSWGLGDLGDLTTLARWSAAEHGADFVLVNPLHAAEVMPPMQPSPYLPVTRSFANPLYLAVPGAGEVATSPDGLLDRDAAWAAKRAELERLFATSAESVEFEEYRMSAGGALHDFATWCALTEVHGADASGWPAGLQRPGTAEVAQFAEEHADAVAFHEWCQWQLSVQLSAVQRAAVDAGMRVGIVHDLAVGVSPTGADAWARHDQLATSVTVGAPPDAYSQTGQDWDQPPWRPDRLADLAYAPFRELFGDVLRHSGGLRVDHVIGLFRLWWIPRGLSAREGTYVRYDHDALIGTLMIEASRAGAVLIGEDLGNVEPWVRDYLRERGILGTSILWFESEDAQPLPPSRWRELCLASVTTHDLPPTAGYLAGDHVRLRHELGLLTESYSDELERDTAEREKWLAVLRSAGLPVATTEEIVLSLHRLLSSAPSLLRCAALVDVVGDRRIQNQPGTSQEQYPNWRVPLSGPDGEALLLEDVIADPAVAAFLDAMRG